MQKPFDVKDLELKLAPVVMPALIAWIEESVQAQLAAGVGSDVLKAVLAILPGVLESSKQSIVDAVVKAIQAQG